MSKQPRGLGKGLGALLGEDLNQIRKPVEYVNKTVITPEVQERSADIMLIPVDMIEPNPFQPRLSFDAESLNELADSVKTLGLIQPITVRRKAPLSSVLPWIPLEVFPVIVQFSMTLLPNATRLPPE